MNVIDHGMNVAEATMRRASTTSGCRTSCASRRASASIPSVCSSSKGHKVALKETMGSTQSILVTERGLFGSSDPRTPAALTLGY